MSLINIVLEGLAEGEIVGTTKYAVKECCAGELKESKTDILRILFIKTKDLEGLKINHDLRKHLKADDPRYKLFDEFNQGAAAQDTIQAAEKKKKRKDRDSDEITLEYNVDVDKDLMDFINQLDLTIRKLSKEGKTVATVRKVSMEKFLPEKEGIVLEKREKDIQKDEIETGLKDEEEESKIEHFADEEDVKEEDVNFDLTLEDGAWEVECTQDVYRVLRSRKVPPDIKKKILKKIKQLSTGYWPPELRKHLEGVKKGITLFEAKINKGSRILWEISVSFSERRSMDQHLSSFLDQEEKGAIYEDKIRIWNIALQHDAVPKMIEKIVHSHERGQRCILKKELEMKKAAYHGQNSTETLTGTRNEVKQNLPRVYMNSSVKDIIDRVVEEQSRAIERKSFSFVPAASPNKNEYNILKFYSFNSQVASRILSLSNCNYDFPFQVSPLEYAVIRLEPKHRCPILLLGRSGTGKTTCCLYRLWSQFLNYWNTAALSGPQIPRFQKLLSTNEEEEADEKEAEVTPEEKQKEDEGDEEEESSNEDSIVEDCEHLRQVLVTKNEVLCNEIRKNFKELSIGSQVTNYEEIEEIENKNIGDISPQNYPLFLTTKDLLLAMDNSLPGEHFFERDEEGNLKHEVPGWGKNKVHLSFLPNFEFDDSDDEEEEEEANNLEASQDLNRHKKSPKKVNYKRLEVTYEVFAEYFWPKMMKKRKKEEKNCHPSLVWMEIKSFIKGSAEAFDVQEDGSLQGFLTKKDYVDIGRKRAPNFEGNREEIYEMFLLYQKTKKYSQYFDEMDLHFNLYKRLKNVIMPDWAFHQVYVDETQDFTQSELLLLIRSCANPNAMFFTGDTAQSIMSGVAFRFCDLQSLYVVAKRAFELSKLPSPISVPSKVHQLTHNYRSHAGILKLSSTIIKLLEKLFPNSMEGNAKPDVGIFPGPSPVILETDDFTELAILLQGSQRQTSAIEFGAHQVVLVQNEKSKENLPAELSYGLVLSIYEAKGLEFDDVLLYNFFKDSPVS